MFVLYETNMTVSLHKMLIWIQNYLSLLTLIFLFCFRVRPLLSAFPTKEQIAMILTFLYALDERW